MATAEAQLLKGPPHEVSLTAPAALASGQVLQLPDGRAGVVAGLKAPASGDLAVRPQAGGQNGIFMKIALGRCSSVADSSEAPICNDGVDNDGDGRIDFPSDLGCTSLSDADELSVQTTMNRPSSSRATSGRV